MNTDLLITVKIVFFNLVTMQFNCHGSKFDQNQWVFTFRTAKHFNNLTIALGMAGMNYISDIDSNTGVSTVSVKNTLVATLAVVCMPEAQ